MSKDTISNKLYGSLIEFLNHYVNGPRGFWAQELLNRSFDIPDLDFNGTSQNWYKYGDSTKSENIWSLETTNTFNKNGKYSQFLKTSLNNEIGVIQDIYLNDSISHTFYCYYYGENSGPLFLTLRDFHNNIVFQYKINIVTPEWNKAVIKIPPLYGYNYLRLILSIKTNGYIFLDEASLMPDNNIHGIRYEIFKSYEKWKPGIFRYPGGCYADTPQNQLEHCIGDIDQRKSANETWDIKSQRMDFGLHEFIWLCDTLKIEPHITLNLENGSPQLSANYVGYCNSDTNTTWGRIRAINGSIKPFGIKYWEIGNEQWESSKEYAKLYLEHYKKMIEIDSSIKIIIDGNHWEGLKNFDDLFMSVGDKCDIYGYHPALNATPETKVEDKIMFLNMACQSNLYEEVFFSPIQKKIIESGLGNKIKQGLTEWWTNYGTMSDWVLDTNIRNSSLESGITAISMLNGMTKFPGTVELAERTHGLGMIRCEINPNNQERHFFGTPSYYGFQMLRNHHGQHLINSTIITNYYSLDFIQGFWTLPTNPYVDGVVTASKDSLFISIVNRYFDKNVKLKISSTNNISTKKAKVYRLWSENVTDANSYQNPLKVVPEEYDWTVQEEFDMLPHSFYIIAIPADNILEIPNNPDSSKNNQVITVYPNPCIDFIKIYIPDSIDLITEISLFDVMGKNLGIQPIKYSDEYLIHTVNLSKGIYFLKINSKNEIYYQTIIKY